MSDIWATDVKRRGRYTFGKAQIQFYKPTRGYPSEAEAKRDVAASLEPEYVYGYSGNSRNSRQNLIARNGSLVYFIAGAGIVYDIATNTQKFFLRHNDDITTICADPRPGSNLVATGQKDPKDTPGLGKDLPKIWVWDQETMEGILLIDRVCVSLVRRVRWSPATGILYVLCGDDQQSLKAYNLSSLAGGGRVNQRECTTALCDVPTTRQQIMGMIINPKPKDCMDEIVFFCKGKLLVAKVTQGKNDKLVLGKLTAVPIKTQEKAYVDALYFPSGRYVAGGASGGLYFCEGAKLDKEVKGAHGRGIKALCLNESGNVLFTASMDKKIKSWDSRGKGKWDSGEIEVKDSDFVFNPQTLVREEKTDSLFVGSKSNQILKYEMETQEATVIVDGHDGQIWGLAAHAKKDFFITGAWDRTVKVWDPATHKCRKTLEFEKIEEKEMPEPWKIKQVCASPNGNWLAVGTSHSTVAIVSYPRLNVMVVHRIEKANKNSELEGISYLRFSPSGKMLAAAHGDGNLYVFNVVVKKGDDGEKNVTLKQWKPMKHRAAPSHCQWGADGNVVKTLTRDYEVCHWALDAGKKQGKLTAKCTDPDTYQYSGDPLVAGWDVQGLYQKGFDGTDLNDAALTQDGRVIATGDDFGCVRLHNFPAVDPEANREYQGHAEQVVGVDFLASDSHLLSVGGADNAIFQWRVVRG